VQLDKDKSTIKQSLKKNLVNMAQVGHIDENLLKIKDEDDINSSEPTIIENKKEKEESVKSIS